MAVKGARSSADAHPAIAAAYLGNFFEDADFLREFPKWKKLNVGARAFLYARQFHDTDAAAAREIGITMSTVRRWSGASPIFRDAALKVRGRVSRLPDAPVPYMKDKARYELLRLQAAPEGGLPKDLDKRLKIIKAIMDLKEPGAPGAPSRAGRPARGNGASLTASDMKALLGMESLTDPRRPGWVEDYDGQTCAHGRPPALCPECRQPPADEAEGADEAAN